MLVLVHSAPTTLAPYRTPSLGVLSSPRRWYKDVEGWPWAADNDAYSAFDAGRYREMIAGLETLRGCLFVTAPDVVGDSAATLDLFTHWRDVIGFLPAALVAQDGLTPQQVPWDEIAALFVGGSTEWKLSDEAARVVYEAKARGLWVHMGRVNSARRARAAWGLGCDSIDGTGFSWYRDRRLAPFLARPMLAAEGAR